MGQDKALLIAHDGSYLLQRAYALLTELLKFRGQSGEGVFVSGDYPGYRCIEDLLPQRGPLSGVHAALRSMLSTRADYTHLLFVPVDMAGLDVSTLEALLEFGLRQPSEQFKAAHYCGYELPALVKICVDVAQQLTEILNFTGDQRSAFSLGNFFTQLSAQQLRPQTAILHKFININVPADYQAWRKELAR